MPHAPARRLAWLMLLIAALLVRGVLPAGWMPMSGAGGGITLVVCNGMSGGAMAMPAAHGKAEHKHDKGDRTDHPCAFAGVGVADTAAPPLRLVEPISIDAVAPLLERRLPTPGRGLAAPPPPATGPPALA